MSLEKETKSFINEWEEREGGDNERLSVFHVLAFLVPVLHATDGVAADIDSVIRREVIEQSNLTSGSPNYHP
ncbi:hypothetical protein F442_14168 [Phytophthora nicotianae P10297]|uniref:Uncharacterized protein n=3 Tax=Phytophthora nicotianae TaxID=4792 RepID=V9EP12_PHYNI|nr:hypothetical protein F443_14321 [Phytophthora nicotianae P1569]ETK80348.1 hypothetical protein L915_13959 [Phytophthora nicotianae]ETL33766.1 hypothetical protein L916_13860 [Phytophthora nicotianae]ETM40213.1 hypothetical protein L914_13786 [Phytophthora nicotianae]ETP38152.1 hypothetical protein F442_14168 [Phytophthora nicotianae P10297]